MEADLQVEAALEAIQPAQPQPAIPAQKQIQIPGSQVSAQIKAKETLQDSQIILIPNHKCHHLVA